MASIELKKPFGDERRICAPKMEKSKDPAVSVIIPAFNTASYIGEALDSVFAQTFGNYEVIVINDGSPDTEELERVLTPYLNHIVYIKQDNRGLSGARNAGILSARAPLIAILDSDDMWEPDYLAAQVAILRDNPGIDIVYPDAVYFGDCAESGRKFSELCPSKGRVTFESLVTQRCNVMVAVTARRNVIMHAGMFDESLRSAEDFDLWIRVVLLGGRIDYHSRVLVRYRRRADSLTSDRLKHLGQVLRIMDKLSQHPALTSQKADILKKERSRFQALQKFFEGKDSFVAGDYPAAIEAWTEANRFFRSVKIGLATSLMRISPSLVMRMYCMRRRLILGTLKEF